MPRLTGHELEFGLVEAFLPDDIRVQGLLGHPLYHALGTLWPEKSSERVPLEEIVLTVHAFAGDTYYEGAHGTTFEEAFRSDLRRAREGGGFQQIQDDGDLILWFLRERFAEPEHELWLEAPPPQRNLVRTYDEILRLLNPPLFAEHPDPSSKQAAERLVSVTLEVIRNLDIWSLEWQSETLRQGARNDEWSDIREIAWKTSAGGRAAHPAVLEYWKDTRKRLSGIIHDRRSEYEEAGALWWQLWRRERELVDAGTLQDYTPSEVAAYLLWERAGRRKTLVTFARHMGVSLRKDAAEKMVEAVEGG